ncbi:ATP-binding protein [Breoghania sp. L-A4]|uniref:ATP-binding protein n=1 Tax=Breoghania sp. L-A4 TaxID=2304600 RepID=UPI0013C3506D|nr:ATP-binding protein [Breoghania sp. L-A4]
MSADMPDKARQYQGRQMTSTNDAYMQVRSKICNAHLVAITIVAIPTLAASLYPSMSTGWQPVMTLYLVMAVSLVIATLLRNRLPYTLRVGFLIFFFVTIGLAGLWSFGLLAGGIPFLLVAPILAALFLTARFAVMLLAAISLSACVIGASIVLGYQSPVIDAGPYAISAPAWFVLITAWVLTNGSLVLAIGSLNGFLLQSLHTAHDHAEALERSEAQHRRLVANLPEIVYSWTPAIGGAYYSPRVKDVLGHSPAHMIRHPRLWTESVHPDDTAILAEGLAKAEDGTPFDIIYRIRDAKGAWRWLHDRSIDIRREDGTTVVDGIVSDITEQREAEAQLRQAHKMEAIGQLTGGIAHDFNNLLSIMSLNSEILEDELAGNKAARARLDMIHKALDRASSLTNRLLAFSRQQMLSPVPTDIGTLLHSLRELLERTLGAEVHLKIRLSAGLWWAKVDQNQLENALINLAINARDAIPASGLLEMSARNKTVKEAFFEQRAEIMPGDYVVISVRDTGTGMSPETLEHMFEPFFTTKDFGKGSGLGLSMVYGFVAQSNGFVSVDSALGRGTTFRLYLPRNREAALPQPESIPA